MAADVPDERAAAQRAQASPGRKIQRRGKVPVSAVKGVPVPGGPVPGTEKREPAVLSKEVE